MRTDAVRSGHTRTKRKKPKPAGRLACGQTRSDAGPETASKRRSGPDTALVVSAAGTTWARLPWRIVDSQSLEPFGVVDVREVGCCGIVDILNTKLPTCEASRGGQVGGANDDDFLVAGPIDGPVKTAWHHDEAAYAQEESIGGTESRLAIKNVYDHAMVVIRGNLEHPRVPEVSRIVVNWVRINCQQVIVAVASGGA